MKTHHRWPISMAIAVFLPSVAAAQQAQHPLAPPVDLDRRVSVDVNAVAPAKIFGMLADTLGCELALDDRLQQHVTLVASNIRARTALEALCESIGCRWRVENRVLRVEAMGEPAKALPNDQFMERMKRPLPTDLTFSEVPLRDVLARLSKETDVTITAQDADVLAPVTADLRGQEMWAALMKVARAAGWGCVATSVQKPRDERSWLVVLRRCDDQAKQPAPDASGKRRVYQHGDRGVSVPVALTPTVRPVYPRDSLHAKAQGTIVLSVIVESDGTVSEVSVQKPLEPGLDLAAIEAARQWRFKPATRDGKPVPFRTKIEFEFSVR